MSLSEVLDEVQRVTHARRDDVIFAAAVAMLSLPPTRDDDRRHVLLLQFVLADVAKRAPSA